MSVAIAKRLVIVRLTKERSIMVIAWLTHGSVVVVSIYPFGTCEVAVAIYESDTCAIRIEVMVYPFRIITDNLSIFLRKRMFFDVYLFSRCYIFKIHIIQPLWFQLP